MQAVAQSKPVQNHHIESAITKPSPYISASTKKIGDSVKNSAVSTKQGVTGDKEKLNGPKDFMLNGLMSTPQLSKTMSIHNVDNAANAVKDFLNQSTIKKPNATYGGFLNYYTDSKNMMRSSESKKHTIGDH